MLLIDSAQKKSILTRMEVAQELNMAQMKEICAEMCGEGAERGVHRIAPFLCPVQEYIWKNPPKRKIY